MEEPLANARLEWMGFDFVIRPQAEVDRQIMLSKRIDILGGMVIGHNRDGNLYVSEPQANEVSGS